MAVGLYRIISANWQNRRLVADLVSRDIRTRYLGSLFGRYWNLLSPLAMILIYTFVFSIVMKAKLGGIAGGHRFAFVIYLCSALLPWNAFVETVSRGTNVFVEQAHLIKKIAFPMEILPAIVAGTATINFLIAFGIYLLTICLLGHFPSEHFIVFIYAYLLQVVFATGLGMFFSVFNVFFRDIEQLVAIIFMAWFWVTPIVYQMSNVPEEFQFIIYLNPYFYFVNLYQKAIFYQSWPNAWELLAPLGIAATAFVVGGLALGFFRNDIPDEI